jgi:hypothetical protein
VVAGATPHIRLTANGADFEETNMRAALVQELERGRASAVFHIHGVTKTYRLGEV